METYIGKKPNAGSEVNLGEKVVLDLLEGIDAAGHNVTAITFLQAYRLQESCWKKSYPLGYNKKK